MADVKYSVEIDYITKNGGSGSASRGASDSIAAAQRAVSAITSATKSMADSVSSSISGIFEGVGHAALGLAEKGIGAAFGMMKIGILEANAKVEDMRISMATLFVGTGESNTFNEGLSLGQKMIEKMREDAATLPGEFKDVATIFRTIASSAQAHGLNATGTEDMAAHAMAFGEVSGLPADVTGRELAAIMEGRAHSRNMLFQRLPGLAADSGGSTAFNAMTNDKRMAMIKKHLGMSGGMEADAFKQMNIAHQSSWVGQLTSLKDKAKVVLGQATNPLFESIKTSFGQALAYMDNSSGGMSGFIEKVGYGLDYAFNRAKDLIIEWFPVVQSFTKHLYDEMVSIWTRIEPYITKAFGTLKDVLSDPNIFNKLEHLLEVAAEVFVGAKGISLGASGLSTVAPIAMMGAGGGAEGAAAVAAAAGPAAAIFAELTAAAYGVWHALTEIDSSFHELVGWELKELKSAFAGIWDSLKSMKPAFDVVAEALGAGFLAALLEITEIIRVAVAVLAFFVTAIQDVVRFLHLALPGGANGAHAWEEVRNHEDGHGYGTGSSAPGSSGIWNSMFLRKLNSDNAEYDRDSSYTPQSRAVEAAAVTASKAKPVVPQHTTHIHQVTIAVNSNQDPSRIAQSTLEALVNIKRNPLVARSNPQAAFTLR